MTIFLTVLHIMVCVVLIVVVLLQHGKGADIGAVFGGGASSTVFGSRGAGNFLTRLTTGAALVFMVTSLWLSYLANTKRSIFEEEKPAAATQPVPAPGGEAKAPEGQAPQGGFEEVKPPAKPGAPPAAAPEGKNAAPPANATPQANAPAPEGKPAGGEGKP